MLRKTMFTAGISALALAAGGATAQTADTGQSKTNDQTMKSGQVQTAESGQDKAMKKDKVDTADTGTNKTMKSGDVRTAQTDKTDRTDGTGIDAGKIRLSDWSYDELYNGNAWAVEDLYGAAVYGQNGDEIGDVEDLVVNADGKVVSLIAEVGGFWDIGDTHLSVPWEKAKVESLDRVTVPVTEDNVDDYDVFADSGLSPRKVDDKVVAGTDDEPLGPRMWRTSELIGDYVRIRDDQGQSYLNYGVVDDILVQDGQIAATLVTATNAGQRGAYAYPYPYGGAQGRPYAAQNWNPGAQSLDMPYLKGDVDKMTPYDSDQSTG